jgi:TolB-like protein
MNPHRTLFAATCLLLIAAAAAPARADVGPRRHGKKIVAVLPFTSPTRYNLMGRNAQSAFITKLVQTRKVRVIQASMVQRMLRRRGLHWTGTMAPRLIRAAGRYLKADYMLAGKLRYGGDAYVLSVHVMNVRTLETTHAEDVDFRHARSMRIAVRAAAKKIAGSISGTGGGGGKSAMFLNVNPRAFYDTSDACIRAMSHIVNRYSFTGTVESTDDSTKSITVKGYTRRLRKGIPLDVFSTSGIDGPKKAATVYVWKLKRGGFEARYRMAIDEGIELGAKVTNGKHRWTVAVGKVVDEVEDHTKLVKSFRSALLEKMSEGTKFQQIEGGSTDWLARLSNRRQRFMTFRKLFKRGIDVVLEGKFYGSSGRRRAHFKIYSTLTGKLLGEPKFETRL